jgi:hypothetical protein
VIAAAAGPIGRSDMVRFLHVAPAELVDALQPALRYLLPGDDLQFVHVELRRRVAKGAGHDLADTSAKLVAWSNLVIIEPDHYLTTWSAITARYSQHSDATRP